MKQGRRKPLPKLHSLAKTSISLIYMIYIYHTTNILKNACKDQTAHAQAALCMRWSHWGINMPFHDVAILITLSFRLIFDWRIISCWLQMKQEYTAGIVMTRALCSVPLHATCMWVFLWTLYILQNYDESFGTTPSWILLLFLDASQLYSMWLLFLYNLRDIQFL